MTRAQWLRAGGLGTAWILFAGFALWGVPGVPFHPDESTYLYMSRDFDLLFRQGDPAAVTWRAANQAPDVVRYRLLDSPLTHYLPGLGRLLAGYARPLPRDWDWSADWAGNLALGAVPESGLLDAARWPAALLTALSLLPLYGIGSRVGGTVTGLVAVALYACSGLVLLHGRRAMAEGPLLFFSLLTVWLIINWPRQPLLWGASAAFAVASKLTALALLPVVGVAIFWRPSDEAVSRANWKRRIGRDRVTALLLCTISFAGLSWLLTPPLWDQPIAGLRAMLGARQQLVTSQTGGISAAAPGQVAGSLGERLFAMLYHVYFAPPAFWDVPNYVRQTGAAEVSYLALPLQAGWHTTSLSFNLIAGGMLLALTLAGIGFSLHDLAAYYLRAATLLTAAERQTLIVLLAWSGATVAGLLPINIAWQRYYLPLMPIVCLWAAYGMLRMLRPFARSAGNSGGRFG
jgi:4-amino-4-deoxy-L-arabinose transferase-like glycosyltransferase